MKLETKIYKKLSGKGGIFLVNLINSCFYLNTLLPYPLLPVPLSSPSTSHYTTAECITERNYVTTNAFC